ncbi:hypothetical protein ACHAWF_012903, partial [Thalassiosira exigua]
MTMAKSKAKATKAAAAAGLLAACAASSASSPSTTVAGALPSRSSAAAEAARRAGPPSSPSLETVPRGGHAPASAETSGSPGGSVRGGGGGGGDGRRKKKRKPKPKGTGGKSKGKSGAASEGTGEPRDPAAEATTPDDDASASEPAAERERRSDPLPPAARSILSHSCHYDVLGITKSATSEEIRKAYRRRCVLTHPDKTDGDRSAFDKVAEAYDVLGCEVKRERYDRFGKEGVENGTGMGMGGMGGMSGGPFGFGTDAFRDFFSSADPFSAFGRGASSHQQYRRPPRNRDLKYRLEATLEELYAGTTKRVAVSHPDPTSHFPVRKEVEVTLPRGLRGGEAVRLPGAADAVPDAAPADIVFVVRERRHPIFARRGCDLAMDVKISSAESLAGFRRRVKALVGKEMTIGSPAVERTAIREEVVEVPSLPSEDDNSTAANVADEGGLSATPETTTETTTVKYRLPPAVLKTGDVLVLKGHGMPRRGHRHGAHDAQFGDLYVQLTVEAPETNADAERLSPAERVELARLLAKLEGGEDPSTSAVQDDATETGGAKDGEAKEGDEGEGEDDAVRRLSPASASDFGKSDDGDRSRDEHLPHEDDEEDAGRGHQHRHASEFFRQAFGGGGRPAGGFGFSSSFGDGGGGFRYYSSSSGG